MSDLNKQKIRLENKLIEDKLSVEKYKIYNLKSDVENVLKKYTKSDKARINFNIKILSTGEYKLEFRTIIKDFY